MSLEIGRPLGRGTFGTVFLVKYNGKISVMKLIDVHLMRQRMSKPQLEGSILNDETIIAEIKSLTKLSENGCSEYVVCLYGALDYKGKNKYVALIMEYIDGKELSDWLQKKSSVPPEELKYIMYQLILGLSFIHGKGFAHRDIKGENIMITNKNTVKYIDFGYACADKCDGFVGTRQYIPPETFQGLDDGSLDMAQAKDVWSLAMVFYELANGYDNFPYVEDTPEHMKHAPEKQSNYTLDDGKVNQFLEFMMINDWRQRPTINEVLLKFQEMFIQQ